MDKKRRLLLHELESVRIIRFYTKNIEESWKIRVRNDVFINMTQRSSFIDLMFKKWFEKIKYEQVRHIQGYWNVQEEDFYLKKIHFFWRNQCTCGKNCIHIIMKKICNNIALQRMKEIGLGDIIFKFLY